MTLLLRQLFRYRVLIPLALILGPAPYFSEPHIAEKLRMLASGVLSKPVDMFDLFLHASPLILLGFKAGTDLAAILLSRKTS